MFASSTGASTRYLFSLTNEYKYSRLLFTNEGTCFHTYTRVTTRYHHVSVLAYCWLAMRSAFPSALFGVLNACVHSVMYYYYGRAAQGARLRFAKFITVIQLSQMVAGLALNVTFVALYALPGGGVCDGGEKVREDGTMLFVLGCTAAMYASYLLLFAQFYVQRYASKTETKIE